MHPNGYTKEDIKRILGSSWPTMPEDHETGNQLRRRKGQEMRAGIWRKRILILNGVVKYHEWYS